MVGPWVAKIIVPKENHLQVTVKTYSYKVVHTKNGSQMQYEGWLVYSV